MLPLDTLIAFFGIAVLLALTPGPDNLFVLMQSALWGRKAGFLVVLGLCTGLLGHTAAVALGLAAVFATSPMAFVVLKLAGAIYLLYLAWQTLRAPTGANRSQAPAPLGAGALYRRGIIMNLTNPKVLLFFFAFLPQFTQIGAGPLAWQIIELGAVFMAATLLIFGAIAVFSGGFGQLLQRSTTAERWLNRLAGVVFIGLALRLATASR
ncbi:LysE family translocator [Bordetella holmesii]|uniref:Translocator protein, LysE family n=2 Tax=Bordetella holmesii TaxID=35814 RepID=A0A158MAV2_9BORD|nr:LysE family translocator [Bordetella holmesii]AIT26171.1 lysE type translocator family protein [Bordetella holmesii 44057]EWM46743.1 lysE type translocator family protein [Bordetella holmesii 35009]EWM50909.1 lysE type translocator family protein [Bordetella holmesii 70147]AMD45230.1 threonine transporter RhtB [Bordetella holmesii H558]AOB34117.1 threonine transporter RhtB [Bordetella holmesii]